MTRETPLAKAARYLAERRVTLEAVEDDRVRASVRGETGTYRTTWDRSSGWYCDCPAPSTLLARVRGRAGRRWR